MFSTWPWRGFFNCFFCLVLLFWLDFSLVHWVNGFAGCLWLEFDLGRLSRDHHWALEWLDWLINSALSEAFLFLPFGCGVHAVVLLMSSSVIVFSIPNESNHFILLVSAALAGRRHEVFILGDSAMSSDEARTADNSITVLDTSGSSPSPAGAAYVTV